MIKVSVIVPVYNVEKYVDKCLKSLVCQTLKEIEIIVVNDGSPDNSQKIIDKYVKKYPSKMKSYIKENGGLSSARNYGLKYAKGKYISFVDSDDWLDKNALLDMYNTAIENNSDIVICNMRDYYEDGSYIDYNCTKYNIVYEVTASACNKIFKRNIIDNEKFYDGIWYEDLNFTTKILLKNPKINTISKSYYNCNSHDGSITNNNNSKKNLDIIIAINDLIDYAKKNNCYDENIFGILIYNHILITGINRVAKQKCKDKKAVLNELRQYCKDTISNYKKLPFYKNLKFTKKIIGNLNYYGLYNVSKFLLNVKSKL